MSDSVRNSKQHIKLFIPGPVEVRPKILDAQAQWMVGHRMPELIDLYSSINANLKKVLFTNNRVFAIAGTGTGFWEGAARNCVREKVLHCTSGAFSDKWVKVSKANGKQVDEISAEWGQPIPVEPILEALATGEYDSFALVHNETSTGITNPVQEICAAIRALPNGDDIIIMIDSVSGLSGAELRMDDWDIDVVVSSSQKAFALPPGLAIGAVSDRAMARAATIENRGYVYDFIELAKYYDKDQTPSTSPVSLLYALDVQLKDMMEETMEGRFARHIAMRDMTIAYVKSKGFELYGDENYASPTVTNIANNLNVDIVEMNNFLRTKGMFLSNGYGARLKGKAFRIAHMGDIMPSDLEQLFAALDEFLD